MFQAAQTTHGRPRESGDCLSWPPFADVTAVDCAENQCLRVYVQISQERSSHVVPAETGAQRLSSNRPWIPACARISSGRRG